MSGHYRRKELGFTIIEMITVLFIVSLLGGIVTGFIIKNSRDNQRVQAQSLVQKDLNLGIDRISRVLRSATKILEATETNIKIRGFPNVGDAAPSEINFYLSGTVVKYSVIPPTGTAPNYTYNQQDAVYYTLLTKVTNSTSLPLFNYYDETNTKLVFPVTVSTVRVVEFAPSATDSLNSLTTPVVVSTKIDLRNFKTNL